MDYIKKLIKDNAEALEAEKEAIRHCGNLPVLSKYNTKLTQIQEIIVKTVLLAGGMYIADLKMMLSFSAENQSIERAIKELTEDGYLNTEKNPYGTILGLTKEGVARIKTHPDYLPETLEVNYQEMDIFGESAALKHKCISYAVAEYVFECRLQKLWDRFWTTDIYERNYYLCKQFLKQIVYRDFLKLSEEDRCRLLEEAGLNNEEIRLFSVGDKYIVWTAGKWAELMFIRKGFEEVKKMPGYHEYMQIIKREALKEPNRNTFYLLKDMLTEDEKTGFWELQLLWKWKTTMLKFGSDKYRAGIKGNTELINKEKELDSYNRCLSVLQNERRSLLNQNAYRQKADEKAFSDAVVKLAELDSAISSIRKKKEELETDFSFAVLKSYDGAENDYETKVVTMQRLIQNGVYLSTGAEKMIVISVVQTNEEYFDLFSLHKKLAMGMQFVKRIAPYASVQVRIYTYNDEQEQFIERIFPALGKKLLESKETAFYGNMLDDISSIHKASDNLKERYIFFQDIKRQMEGDITRGEETGSYEVAD